MKTLILTLLIILAHTFANAETLKRVIDGDTIELSTGERVRLYGIDSPETDTLEGQQAKQFLQQAISEETNLTLDRQYKDRYGRTVAIVYADNDDLQLYMIMSGHALVYERYCKLEICDTWREYESCTQ